MFSQRRPAIPPFPSCRTCFRLRPPQFHRPKRIGIITVNWREGLELSYFDDVVFLSFIPVFRSFIPTIIGYVHTSAIVPNAVPKRTHLVRAWGNIHNPANGWLRDLGGKPTAGRAYAAGETLRSCCCMFAGRRNVNGGRRRLKSIQVEEMLIEVKSRRNTGPCNLPSRSSLHSFSVVALL
ncbi:hypothetical protein K440DRAFT_238566 [Wilcoxina mikolae CBS 423.85]|nr:hypothetical protein K440DRAFT_238566 [Wilcoxina mikolae CBS 423.85]